MAEGMRPALGLKRRLLVGFFLLAAQLLRGPLSISQYTAWAIALPMLLWCGKPFHRGLLEAAVERRADAYSLVSISAWAGFLLSTVVVFVPERLPFGTRYHRLREMAALIELSLLGAWIERLFQKKTGEAADKLMRRVPTTARVLRSGREETVTLREVQAGEFIVVEAGEQVPLDGEVVDGHSRVEESAWTGSGVAVEKSPGSRISGGSINKSRRLVLSVLRDKSEMSLSRILAAVQNGIAQKRPGLRLADAAAKTFLPGMVVAAALAASLFFWKGPPPRKAHAFFAAGVALSCACPWLLIMVTPLSLFGGIRRLASQGVSVRNPEILERMPRIDSLVIDKKGILTVGKPEVAEVLCLGAMSEERLLRLAMAAEKRSGHLFAEALRRRGYSAAPARGSLPQAEAFESHPGRGVSAVLEGQRIMVGSLLWLRQNGIEPDPEVMMRLKSRSESMVGIASDGEFVGAVAFTDGLRPGVEDEVRDLARMGIEVVLASGDMNAVVHRVAEGAGINKVYAEVEEEEKVRIVAQLQSSGKKVAMVGEGFRDAPAISRADLGIVLAKPRGQEMDSPGPGHYGAGIDLALESADLVIPRRDLRGLASAIRLSERIRRLTRQNLAFCFGVNVLLMLATVAAQIPAFRNRWTPYWAWEAVCFALAAILLNTLTLRRYSL